MNNKQQPMTLGDILKKNNNSNVENDTQKSDIKVEEKKDYNQALKPMEIKTAEAPKDKTVLLPDSIEKVPEAAKKIVDILIPEKVIERPDIEGLNQGGLYEEATVSMATEAFNNSAAVKEVDINAAMRAALFHHADNILTAKNLNQKKTENVDLPPLVTPETTKNNPNTKIELDPNNKLQVSPTLSKEIDVKNKRNKRAQLLKSRLGSSTVVYLPNSNLKISIAPNSSLLGKETFLNDATICANSAGLLNMIRYVNTASKDVTLLTADKDEQILKPGSNLKRYLHFSDFKYLILANALAAGEKHIPLNGTCPVGCSNEAKISIEDILINSLTDSEQSRYTNYKADKTHEELTKFWRTGEDKPFKMSQILSEPIDDEDFGLYNEIAYEVIYEEPSLEKFLNIKDLSFALILNRFSHLVPESVKNDSPDKLIEYLVDKYNDRLTTLMQFAEAMQVIKKINTYYISGEGENRYTKYIDTQIIEEIDFDDLSILLDTMDDGVIKAAVDHLRDKYNLVAKFKNNVEAMYGKEAADSIDLENIQDIDISTLLDYMTSFNITNITCDKCGKVHSTEVNSLAMGFMLMREALRRR